MLVGQNTLSQSNAFFQAVEEPCGGWVNGKCEGASVSGRQRGRAWDLELLVEHEDLGLLRRQPLPRPLQLS